MCINTDKVTEKSLEIYPLGLEDPMSTLMHSKLPQIQKGNCQAINDINGINCQSFIAFQYFPSSSLNRNPSSECSDNRNRASDFISIAHETRKGASLTRIVRRYNWITPIKTRGNYYE